MPPLIRARLISCDEAGFTGNKMLDADQPFFAYGSVDLGIAEASAVLAAARTRHPRVRMPELKSRELLKTAVGRDFLLDVLGVIEGRYLASVYNKKMSLACKFFEYVYEPVLQDNNILFYRNNLHRFVSNFLYMLMEASGKGADTLASEFERFMRSLNPADAQSLFVTSGDHDELLQPILRFARGYRAVIAQETHNLKLTGDNGKWVLDLSISAVWDHLRFWANKHEVLDVVCDDSKPLRALASFFDVMIDRPEAVYSDLLGQRERMTWNMSGPVTFASSARHAGIQVADLVAGATLAVFARPGAADLTRIAHAIEPHVSPNCIVPDYEYLDLEGNEAPVNALVLQELADRADRSADPLLGMEAVYAVAKANVGRFHQGLRKRQAAAALAGASRTQGSRKRSGPR